MFAEFIADEELVAAIDDVEEDIDARDDVVVPEIRLTREFVYEATAFVNAAEFSVGKLPRIGLFDSRFTTCAYAGHVRI